MDFPYQTNQLVSVTRLSSNTDYYNLVFKKTERIASAVFYILSYLPQSATSAVHYNQLSTKAMTLHEAAMSSLAHFEHELPDVLFPLQHALLAVESALTVATSARFTSGDIVLPVVDEIDQVLRYIKHHYADSSTIVNKSSSSLLGSSKSDRGERTLRSRRQRPVIPKNDLSSDAVLVYSDITDRSARIKTVLEAKPEATIKDLTDIITDVSAKTIQRDLNAMIESGEVIRQGERRWSKYSLSV
jgi:hypothetical protein